MAVLFCIALCAAVFAQPVRTLPLDKTAEKKEQKADAAANTVSENGFAGKIENGVITIIGYSGASKDLVIPEKINNLPVVSIGQNAFASKQLNSVVIPNSVKTIDENAFLGNRLAKVTIGNSVTLIGRGAFSDNQLTSVVIPNSVITIGYRAFANNKLRGGIAVPNPVANVDSQAFDERVNVKIGQTSRQR